jgi:hypothetical protein
MLIKEETLRHCIHNFYGYGSWYARFWFVGHEEADGEVPEDVADKINYFTTVNTQIDRTLCDIRQLYRHVAVRSHGSKANSFNSMSDYRFHKNAIQDSVWKNLIAFEHGYKQTRIADILAYQQHYFLSSSQAEALIQLYP